MENIDQSLLIPAYLQNRGLVKQHLESFNYFINTDIKQIVRAPSNSEIRSSFDPNFYLRYTDIEVGTPQICENNFERPVTPHECRIRDLTYSAPITVSVEYLRGDTKVVTSVEIGSMPMMLGCSKCVLFNKSFSEIAQLGECPYDPKGYFIVKGAEKVILVQEQASKNRIMVTYDSKGGVKAEVTSSTHEKKSHTVVYSKNAKFYLKHNTFAEDLPISIVFKALGLQADQELFHMVGTQKEYLEALSLSLQDSISEEVITQQQALQYIGAKVRNSKISKTGKTRAEEAKELLATVVLSHVPCENYNFRSKARYLGIMVRKVIDAINDPSKIDDRDYYGNKRLELAGQLVGLLFEDLFKRLNSELKKHIDKIFEKPRPKRDKIDIKSIMRTDIVSQGLAMALTSGNWSLKRFKMERAGVTEVLSRLSYMASMGMMSRVNSQFEKTRKIAGPRSLQSSQFGVICPADTPEGESCGLVKTLALTTHITIDMPEEPIVRLAYSLGIEDANLFSGDELYAPGVYKVFLNGLPLGVHQDADFLVSSLRALRRKGLLSEYVSVVKLETDQQVHIACDGGRLTRPLIIVEHEQSCVLNHHLQQLACGLRDFDDFLTDGLVEFLDVNEENNARIAMKHEEITSKTTHLEINPFTILGAVAGLIPYPHHNQSPRNTYQCAMGKQALGAIAHNQFERVDTVLYLLAYPQRPLVKTRTIELVNYENLPAGHNASVAVMSYSAYDIEDAVILNKASIERGFGKSLILKRVSSDLKMDDRLIVPPEVGPSAPAKIQRFHACDKDGLPRVGASIQTGDVMVNKQIPIRKPDLQDGFSIKLNEEDYKSTPQSFKGPNPVQVHRVFLTSSPEASTLIKIVNLETREPELGDKFSSRHGQKGVVGLIAQQEDMPFNEMGVCPDLIMNPHGFPSRMTVGKLIELIAGKAGVLNGVFKYGTAFAGDPVTDCAEQLVSSGFNYSGKDLLTCGTTGQPIQSYIFAGPIFYQKLKHMVADKMHARARGQRTSLTRQPTEGRAREGGLRLGEMERDCLIGYGAASLIQERLLYSSDLFSASVCEECGELSYERFCEACKSGANIVQVNMPYACKLLFQELQAMNIRTRLKLNS